MSVQNKDSKLINADCLEELKKLQDKSIDFILIDPPYELDNHGGGKSDFAQRQLVKDLHIDFISYGFDIIKVFKEVERVSKTINLICFCSNKQISKIMSYWEQKKLSTTLLVWDKPNPVPFGNGKHISNLEFIVYVRGKGATFNNLQQTKSFKYSSPSSKLRIHPTEKPVPLIERLIQLHTKENDIVLDCFSGSGSLAISCINTNRNYICIEKDEDYYHKSAERINNHLLKRSQQLFNE